MYRSTTPLVAVLAVAALLIGCEDPAAEARAEAHQVLQQAAMELSATAVMGADRADDDFESAQQQLEGIIGKLGRVGADAEPGQRAAGGLIKAAALRAIADRELRTASEISDAHRLQRLIIGGQIDAASRLDAFADGRSSIDFSVYDQQLEADRSLATTQKQTFEQAKAELDPPIAELVDANEAALAEVHQLRTESNDLLARARELGNVEGFEYFEQAMAKQRQADQLEYQIAQREISLEFDLEPRQQLTMTYDRYTSELIEELEQSSQSIAEFSTTIHQGASDVRQAADELWASTVADTKTLSESMSVELAEIYASVISNLEQAVTSADQAGRQADREGKMSAALSAARAQEMLGHVHRRMARDLADQRLLIQQIVASANTSIASPMQSELDRLTAEHATALSAANEAYSSAGNLLNQAGTGDELQQYKNAIARASTSVTESGQPEPPAPRETEDEDEPGT